MIRPRSARRRVRFALRAAAFACVAGAFALAACDNSPTPAPGTPGSPGTPGTPGSAQGSGQGAALADATPVRVVAAWTAPLDTTARLVGTMRAMDSVRITTEVSGVVEEINFEDEDFVEPGQMLVRLDDRRAAADVRAEEARVDRARLRLRRVEDAYERGGANISELEDARADLREAEALRDRAALIVENHVLRAPFAGRVSRRNVSLGALVNPGDSVTTLTSVDPIEITFSVPETHIAKLRTGLRVAVETPAYAEREFEGTLRAVGSVVDVASRNAEVFATIPNPGGLLRPGMFGAVTLSLDTREDAIIVPESALLIDGTRVEVFVVERGVASRVRVRTGERRPGIIEIVEGLAAGDVVVTSGLQRLLDGAPVRAAPDEELVALGVVPRSAIADLRIGGVSAPANAATTQPNGDTPGGGGGGGAAPSASEGGR